MRLALDAMGGDDAPQSMVSGAVDYARLFPKHEVILVGREADIKAALEAESATGLKNISIRHTDEVIGMADKIGALREKKNDSINVASRLVKDGEADAVILCGNTGCSVAAAQMHLRRIPGVSRAGILTPLPSPDGLTWVVDCGANSVGKPEHLCQFAEMAYAFLQKYEAKAAPRVGVLSIGSEDEKGTDLTRETLRLVRETDVNSIGYIEGNDIFTDKVDVVVCDGFTGNVTLKAVEGMAKMMTSMIKDEAMSSLRTKIGGLLMKPVFKALHRKTHWSLVGGCLLLGVDGITIIGHGRSNRVAVEHALKQAARCIETGVMDHLRQRYTDK